ncbi:MAG: hypothetical protein EPO24_07760 [Bacteroidetes bacterium]|nr:MAG: hypothetical protein EPO24_07760 [Bacteroidota bacterium]
MKEKILALLKALNLPDEKFNEVKAKIEELKLDAPSSEQKTTTEVGITGELKTLIDALRQDNKELKDALAAEKTERENGIKSQKERADAEAKAKREAFVKKMKDEGRVAEADVPTLETLLQANFDATVKAYETRPVLPGFKPADDGKGKKGSEPGAQGGEQNKQTPAELRAAAAAAFKQPS